MVKSCQAKTAQHCSESPREAGAAEGAVLEGPCGLPPDRGHVCGSCSWLLSPGVYLKARTCVCAQSCGNQVLAYSLAD